MTRRVLLVLGVAFSALILILLLLLAWGLGTVSGSRTVLGLAMDAVPGLTLASVEGKLAGPLKISDLRYADEYRDVSVESVDLDWLPSRLFSLSFQLQSLRVAGVQITQLKPAPPNDQESEFELPGSIEFPIDLVLKNIALQDVQFRSSPEAEPFEIDDGQLTASLVDQRLAIDELSIRGPLFSIRAVSKLITRDNFDSTTTIEWSAQPPDFAGAAGELRISGGLAKLAIEHSVSAPYTLEQSVTLNNIASELEFDAVTHIVELRLSKIGDTLPDLALTGDIRAQGDINNISLDTALQVDSPDFGKLMLRASAGLNEQVLAISEVVLEGEGGVSLSAGGEIDLRGDVATVDLKSRWQALRWPLAGDPRFVAESGSANLSGTAQDYALRVDSQLRIVEQVMQQVMQQGVEQIVEQVDGSLILEGTGDAESFDLSRLQIALLDGSLKGFGKLRWAPFLQGDVELSGTGINPALFAPELPGDLQLELRASGSSRNGVVFARVDAAKLSGSLRDLPVDAELNAQLDAGRFDLQSFRLVSGDTVLTAQGQADDVLDLDWSLKSPSLGELLPGARGSIEGQGHVGGKLTLPALRVSLAGSGLNYREYALETLSLEADIDLERPTPSTLQLSLDEGALGDITLDAFELTGKGTREAHDITLTTATSLGSAEVGLSGELRDKTWMAQFSRGNVKYAALDPWTLTSEPTIQVSADAQMMSKGCWSSGEARLCVEGARGPDSLSADVDMQKFALTYLQSLLPAALALEGRVDARVSLAQRASEDIKLDAQVTAEDVTLHRLMTDSDSLATEPALLIAFEPSSLTVFQDDAGTHAQLSAPLRNAGGIAGEITIEPGDAPLGERPLRGEIDFNVPDIGVLTALSPELDYVAGALDGQLAVAGSLGKPETEGEIALRDGAVHLATPGIEASRVNVAVKAAGAQTLEFTGEAVSGQGTLALSGTARLGPDGNEADITVNGDAFQVVDTPDARVFVSPALDIAVRNADTRVSGEVLIPRAAITPRKLPVSAVSPSSDQIIVNGDSAAPLASGGVQADVRVRFGDDVVVDGFGFMGRLTGSLLVEQSPNRPTLGTGQLTILDGEYRAYGQGLVIEEGNILFAGGPVERPGIQVRAVRRPANDILVGVRVRGPVQEPQFELFAEPAMSQTETLSWLVLGRPLAGSSEGQGDMLAQAATMLGIKGGNYLADRFGGDLGVDSIGFETGSGEAGAASDVNQAALVIGKYLSPDLFVSYGIGLFDSISTITLDYSLNKHWSLSTESSTDASGGDINYVIER